MNFAGVFPYLVSPVGANGHVKTDVLSRLADDLIVAGVHGLTPLGSTGEFAYLRAAQRTAVVLASIEAAGKRVPVVAGVASTSIADAVEQATLYQRFGADGILAICEATGPKFPRMTSRGGANLSPPLSNILILNDFWDDK